MKFPKLAQRQPLSAEALEVLGIQAGSEPAPALSTRFAEFVEEWLESNERQFKAEAKGDTLEITIMDVIGGGYWYDGVTAKGVKRALDSAPNAKTVKVLINSPGGSVFEGLAIANLLKRHAARVEVEVLGYAASAASVIAMAGDHIAMHEGTFVMIHECWTYVVGNARDMRAEAEVMEKINTSMIDLYTRRTGGSREEIAALVAAETWLTSDESKAKGFADEVIPGKAPAAKKSASKEAGKSASAEPSTALDGTDGGAYAPPVPLNLSENTSTKSESKPRRTALSELKHSGVRPEFRRL